MAGETGETGEADMAGEAVAIMSLRDGKITDYREVVNSGTAFADMGFHPERLFKIFARKAAAMKTWPEAQPHLHVGDR